MKNILVLGGGFAGLWSAIGAARKRAELGIGLEEIEITLIDRNPYHGVRVRNYENDLAGITIPFADVLDPVAVKHLTATVSAIDHRRQVVEVATAAPMPP